ncbi:hypothetical protein ABI59_13810 [Acidobacteria bacterium Mor1]|nr:hypothetical protein ABI59_13810 [Acidobacteria bacterium Mor1]
MADDFQTTRWSVVLSANDPERARLALEWLCGTYWRPLYAFVRRRGNDPEKAADLTQAYFLELMDKEFLGQIDPAAGKFRAFLLASMKNFMSKSRERERAAKRRADDPQFQVALDGAEGWYQRLPADGRDPAALFEHRWAIQVFERARKGLEEEHRASGKAEDFRILGPYLTDPDNAPYSEAAAQLGKSEGAVKTAIHRMRRRLGTHLRQQVACTIADPDDIDDELKHLLSVLSG